MKILGPIFILAVIFFLNQQVFSLDINNSQIAVGSRAPYFELEGYLKNTNKNKWQIDDLSGSWVVLYFYPKDFTQGCTLEAKGFERLSKKFKSNNAQIVGISNDPTNQHESFCSKEDLSLLLLADNKGTTSKAYESWSPPFSERNTFLIDPKGIIRYKWENVNPSTHPKEVLNTLTNINK